jgi:glutaredoxin 3
MAEIEIFTQAYCPYCARAVGLLQQKGVAFREINAPYGSPERRDAMARSGGRTTVPQIFINGASIGGCDDLVALDRAGRLDPLLAA